jgi:hypothetical protein
MTGSAPRICLIAPGHVSSTPRLVKNADALAAAGYRVRVVAARSFPPADPLDAEIFATARWDRTVVDQLHGGVFLRNLLRRVARRLVVMPSFASVKNAARAHYAGTLRLAAAAASQPAELYLGHGLAGLPAAALAARTHGAPYGFDAEDFHDAETIEAMADPAERTARRVLQSALLPGCAHLTAASPLISRQYLKEYGIEPVTLLNVFPRAQAPAAPVDPGPVSPQRPARFYWFSQTVGPGRGLEAIIAVLGLMRTPVELHLRGFAAADFVAQVQRLAARTGPASRIQFLPPGNPSEMARLAAGADLGLSLEEVRPLNRDICLTNKIFVYLLAGIPQFLSNTTAQAVFAGEIGAAGLVGDPSRPDEIAGKLDAFFGDPLRVAAARRAAWSLAQTRYCWDIEQGKLLRSVEKITGRPS